MNANDHRLPGNRRAERKARAAKLASGRQVTAGLSPG